MPARVPVAAPVPVAARARVPVAALGTALAVLVSAAWGTGAIYLFARLGLPAPVRLAVLDGVHISTGLAGAVVLVAKVVRVRRGRPPGPDWERWVSRSLLVLFAAVLATGALALLPLPGRWPSALVQAHLMTSVWTLAPAGWHVWHHRRRALPWLANPRFWSGIVVAALPALVAGAVPRAASPLAEAGGGAAWVRSGLDGVELDRLILAPDGKTLLAGGDGLYASADAVHWKRVPLPGARTDAAPGFQPAAGHQHAGPHPGTFVQAIVATAAGIYAGTTTGLYYGRTPTALSRLDFPGRALDGLPLSYGYPGTDVRALAAGPGRELWAASSAGPMHSGDGGKNWIRRAEGLTRPSAVTAVAYAGRRNFASDGTGVYVWSGRAWTGIGGPRDTVRLDVVDSALFASAAGGGLSAFRGGHWDQVSAGHVHHSGQAVLADHGRLYAAGAAGVVASTDGGRTWTSLGTGLAGGAGQLAGYRGQLWTATTSGLYSYALAPRAGRPTPLWWLSLAAAALVAGLVSIAAAARPARRKRRPHRGSDHRRRWHTEVR